MNRRAEQNRINELRAEVEDILEARGVELDFGEYPQAIKGNHPDLYLWIIVLALARAIDRNPLTAEDLEAVEGVGPATAQRILDELGQ